MSSRHKSKERSNVVYLDNRTEKPSQFIYIDYQFDPVNDTLHTLSMRFGVAITELKRINSLQNERDIYALKTVKIPVKPNSIHTEKFSDQLKYTDQMPTRLSNSALLNLENEFSTGASSNAANENSQDEDVASSNGGEDLVYIVDRGLDDNLIAETEFISDTTSLLNSQAMSSLDLAVHDTRVKTKQSKEAKKFLKKLDNSLASLKNQNNELLTNVTKNSDQLLPIQTCSYIVERRQNGTARTKKGLINMNVRDTLILACIVVVLVPLLFIIYRYIYISEHTGNSIKPKT